MQRVFTQTELPLNEDGSVFHLCLHPGELAKKIILVGDPDRSSMVVRHFDSIELKRQKREFVTYTGYYAGERVSVISTGIGTGNIDIVLNEVDALHNIDLKSKTIKTQLTSLVIIRVGTCGGLDDRMPPGSHIVSNFAVGFDGLLNHYRVTVPEEKSDFFSVINSAFKDYPLRSGIYTAAADPGLCRLLSPLGVVGITLTCPGFYGPQHRALRVPIVEKNIFNLAKDIKYNGWTVANFEMETAAILGLGKLLGHYCASLSLVMFNRITEESIKKPQEKMNQLISRVLQLIIEK